ncbi:MAG: 50S ribosomal protein L11 methyltransferase, partial [Pseudomonadota bacterium]
VLAIAAAKLWHVPVLALDIAAVAVRTARANVAINGVAGSVRSGCAAGFRSAEARGLDRAPMGYDLVLANILAGPLRRLAPQIARQTAPGGRVVLSGLLARQAAAVRAVYAGHGFGVERVLLRQGWCTLTLRARGARRTGRGPFGGSRGRP